MKYLTAILISASLVTSAMASEHIYVPPPKKPPVPPAQMQHSSLGAGPWIAGYAIGCPAIFLMVDSGLIKKRELTCREAWMDVSSCFLPFIGPMLVNNGFAAHPEWEARCTAKH